MPTLRKRGDRWHCQVRKKGFTPQTKSFRTRAEAERWARVAEAEMDAGRFVSRKEADEMTLLNALEKYGRDVTPVKKGARQEMSILKMLSTSVIAKRPLSSIRSGDIAALRDSWLKEGHRPATVLRRLALLSHVFSISRREWHCESLSNPVDEIRKPRPDNARSRRIGVLEDRAGDEQGRSPSQDELQCVFSATESPVLRDAIELAVETAMRRGELVALRFEDIDLERQVARLNDTKNGDARDVPLSLRAVEVLARLKRGGTSRVINVRADALTRAFDRAVRRARCQYEEACSAKGEMPDAAFLVDLRLHDLRHEATSRLADKFHLHELAKITGHRDPRMLLRYYHPHAEDLAKRLG